MRSNTTQNESGDGMAGSEVSATRALRGGPKYPRHALSLLRGGVSIAVRPCCRLKRVGPGNRAPAVLETLMAYSTGPEVLICCAAAVGLAFSSPAVQRRVRDDP